MNFAWGQISVDRTRLVFNHGATNSQSLKVTNNSKTPFLAQTWIEDDQGTTIVTPLVALPILQRLDPNNTKNIKLELLSKATAKLPQDRESLFYLNILAIPPETEGEIYGINLIYQIKLKMFYRPKALTNFGKNNQWLKDLKVSKKQGQLIIENPTPFHIVAFEFDSGPNSKVIAKDLLIKPFSSDKVDLPLPGNNLSIYFINDNGAAIQIQYHCNPNDLCTYSKFLTDTGAGFQELPL